MSDLEDSQLLGRKIVSGINMLNLKQIIMKNKVSILKHVDECVRRTAANIKETNMQIC